MLRFDLLGVLVSKTFSCMPYVLNNRGLCYGGVMVQSLEGAMYCCHCALEQST